MTNEVKPQRIHDSDLYYELDGWWSYLDRPFTGTVYHTYPEEDPAGRVVAETDLINGWETAKRSWHPNGQLEEEIIFDTFYGAITRRWHENGRLAEEEEMEGGPVSRRKQWDEEGNLIEDFVMPPDHPRYRRVLQIRELKKRSQNKAETSETDKKPE